MKTLRQQRGSAMILITHDLGVVAETCDQVAVMLCGVRLWKRGRWSISLNRRPSLYHRAVPIHSLPGGGRGYAQSDPGLMPDPTGFLRAASSTPAVTGRRRGARRFVRAEEIAPGHWVRCLLCGGRGKGGAGVSIMVEARNLSKQFPVADGTFTRWTTSASSSSGEDTGRGGRIRLWEIHVGQAAGGPGTRDGG